MADHDGTAALKRQFACAHRMLREAISALPPAEWRTARHDFFVPARLAFHVIQATDFHLDANPNAYRWDRFGMDWEQASPTALPDQPQVLAYLAEVEAKLDACLARLTGPALLAADYAGFFPTALDHLLYTLRHIQHHTAQINAELKVRGLKPARWR